MTERRPLSAALRVFLLIALVLVGVGAAVAIRAFARRPDRRTVVLLESLRDRARACWNELGRRSLVSRHDDLGLVAAIASEQTANLRIVEFLNRQSTLVHDRWDVPVHLRIPGRACPRGYELYSCGPNRVDEQGEGDDILVGENIESEAEYTRRVLETLAERVRHARPIAAPEDSQDVTGLRAVARELGGTIIMMPGCSPDLGAILGSVEFLQGCDGWGRVVRYRCPGPVHRKGWDLYSLGPNGLDEHGQGDDVLVGEDVAPGR